MPPTASRLPPSAVPLTPGPTRHPKPARTTFLALAALFLIGACHEGNEQARQLRESCNAGKAQACQDYAVKLEKGEYTLRDIPRALALYDTACTKKVGQACTNLAVLLQQRRIRDVQRDSVQVRRDQQRVPSLLAQACDANSMEGCARLGILYYAGARTVPRDPPRATALFQKACDGKDMLGCANLGTAYAAGEGIKQDYTQAAALLKKACEAKIQAGCVGLGKLHMAGTGVVKSDSIGAMLFKGACEGRERTGCLDYAYVLENGLGVAQNYEEAGAIYRGACEERNGEACARMANLHEKGAGVWRSPRRAAEYRKKACELGHKESCEQPKPSTT